MTSYLGGVEGGSITRGDPTAQQTHLVQGGRGVHLVKDRKNSPGQRQKKLTWLNTAKQYFKNKNKILINTCKKTSKTTKKQGGSHISIISLIDTEWKYFNQK